MLYQLEREVTNIVLGTQEAMITMQTIYKQEEKDLNEKSSK
jgi:hypothetical protein